MNQKKTKPIETTTAVFERITLVTKIDHFDPNDVLSGIDTIMGLSHALEAQGMPVLDYAVERLKLVPDTSEA